MRQITADVNKYLKFANRKGEDPVWVDLLDAAKVTDYPDTLEKMGACGPAGQLTKLDRIEHGLRFIRLKLAPKDVELAHQCNVMQEKIKQWKGTIRPAKKMQ